MPTSSRSSKTSLPNTPSKTSKAVSRSSKRKGKSNNSNSGTKLATGAVEGAAIVTVPTSTLSINSSSSPISPLGKISTSILLSLSFSTYSLNFSKVLCLVCSSLSAWPILIVLVSPSLPFADASPDGSFDPQANNVKATKTIPKKTLIILTLISPYKFYSHHMI